MPLATDRDMLAYNIRSDETTVLADGKDKSSQWSLCLSVCLSVCDVYCSFPATVPECGLTTRMCFDEKRKEVVLMTVSIL